MGDKKKNVKRLCSYKEIGEYAQSCLFGRTRETILLVLLNSSGQILFSDIVYEGSVNAAEIYFRDLVRLASSYDAVEWFLPIIIPVGTVSHRGKIC